MSCRGHPTTLTTHHHHHTFGYSQFHTPTPPHLPSHFQGNVPVSTITWSMYTTDPTGMNGLLYIYYSLNNGAWWTGLAIVRIGAEVRGMQ